MHLHWGSGNARPACGVSAAPLLGVNSLATITDAHQNKAQSRRGGDLNKARYPDDEGQVLGGDRDSHPSFRPINEPHLRYHTSS